MATNVLGVTCAPPVNGLGPADTTAGRCVLLYSRGGSKKCSRVAGFLQNNPETNVGFPMTPTRLGEAENNPCFFSSQLSDVQCPVLRHRVRPASRHASYCTHGPLACSAAESAKNNRRPPENSMPKRKNVHVLHIPMYILVYGQMCQCGYVYNISVKLNFVYIHVSARRKVCVGCCLYFVFIILIILFIHFYILE